MPRERVGRKWTERVNTTANVDEKYLNILVWGLSGSGKTHFAGTAPKPFLINTDKGELTLFDKDIPYVTIDGTMQVYETIMAILDSARKKKDGFEEVETVILDSVWQTSDLLLEEICEENNVRGKPSFNEWGILLTRISAICKGFSASPYNFIATSGEATRTDEMDPEEKVVGFNFSGSFRDKLPYLFDFNLYLKAQKRGKEMVYSASTVPENKRTAKSRVPMPTKLMDPNFTQVRGYVDAGLKKEKGE